MSLGNMFSSNGKQAAQAASGVASADQNMINQTEQYTTQQQQAARDALNGMGQNPWFAASQSISPSAFQVNPNDTTTFGAGAGAPGVVTGTGMPTVSVNAPAATSPATPPNPTTQPVQIKPTPPATPTPPNRPITGPIFPRINPQAFGNSNASGQNWKA